MGKKRCEIEPESVLEKIIDDYNTILLEARQRIPGITRQVVQNLVDMYARLLVGIQTTGTIDAAKAEKFAKRLRHMFGQLGVQFMGDLLKGARLSARMGAQAHADAILEVAGATLGISFDDIPTFALEHMQTRRALAGQRGFTALYKSLIERNLQQYAKEVDQLLFQAVAEGMSADNLTKGLAKSLARNEPEVLEALKKLGPNGGKVRNAILDSRTEDLLKARSVLKRAKLISVHEINSAHDEADKIAAMRSPVVSAVKWRLSGNHPKADACDVMAESDFYGLGEGVFPAENVPSLLHPRCRCWTQKVLRDPAEWDNPKPEYGRYSATNKKAVKTLIGDRTDRYVESQTNLANKMVRLAYEASRREAVAA